MKIVNPRSEYFPELQSFVATEENSLSIIKMHQVHGDRVVMVTDPHQEIGEADGMVTIVKNVVLSVCVADCGNIYAYDPIAYTIGICHSGWRSTHLNIVSKMIQSLQKLGSDTSNIYVYAGPSICPSCHQFTKQTEGLFDDKYYEGGLLNLRSIWKDQFIATGLHDKHIIISDICTMCEPNFPSYKRDGTEERMVGVISMK